MSTKTTTEKKTVKGGWIRRDARTGRFVEVGSDRGVSKASPKTEVAARAASSKRSEALKRLADRNALPTDARRRPDGA